MPATPLNFGPFAPMDMCWGIFGAEDDVTVQGRPGSRARALAKAARRLGVLPWVVVAGCIVAIRGLQDPQQRLVGAPREVLVVVLFLIFAGSLVRTIVRDPTRRGPVAVLLVGVTLWSAGAMAVAVSSADGVPTFPAVAKMLILTGYAAFAGYLLLDAGAASGRKSLGTWLDVVVICGGTASLSAGVVVLPRTGVDVAASVLALLVPVLDVMLAVVVVGQVALRIRRSARNALPLSAAFVLFAFADSHFAGSLSAGTQSHALLNTGARIVGFALLVASARRSPEAPSRDASRIGGPVTAAATVIAIAALALRPGGSLGAYLAVPSALTLLGSGGLLMLALRESRQALDALARSHTDDLTRLPNRRALRERIDASLARGAKVAVIVLDLDGFKDINDTLGHSAGDDVLREAAARIRTAVPALATVARLGGDEFAILAPLGDYLMMMDAAQEVLDALSEPLLVDGIDLALSASVGIVDSGEEERVDGDELVRRAEVAMYRAKEARYGIALYDPLHDEFSKAKLRISDELRRGIQNGELEVWYQPQIDASTLRPCALEALVRWRHPTEGVLTPVAFLPAARRAGLMPALSQEVVRLAVTHLSVWHAAGLRLRVAINCAPPELLSGVFVPRLRQALVEARLPDDSVVLEVTEESFIAEPERAREILQDVRQQGIQISIDDYGTGFSSLAYLRDLPVDELKLDRTFVSSVGWDARSRMIVASTVQMARGLGLRSVAEGVEDAGTAADLIAIGVDALQGYHISRPMPASEVVDWIVQWPTFADVRLTVPRGAGASDEALPDRG